jgi:chemosensory pili system protein ChpA (sensor histidine kinase/response regulator)
VTFVTAELGSTQLAGKLPRVKLRPTVLVVDDDRDLRELFTRVLRIAGFDVRLAVDGVTALRQIEHQVPDAVVLDLDLPHINGQSVQQELREHEHKRHLPIIVVTGTDWSLPVPPFATFQKPVQPDDLVNAVRKAVSVAF